MQQFHTILTALERPARFYFLRHGESEGNVTGKMQGRMNSPLTERGRSQAAATGDWFAQNVPEIDRLFTSPLDRAAETAAIVARTGGYPAPQILPALQEINTGIFTGYSFPEIQERYPTEYAEFTVRSWEVVPEAESVESLVRRSLDTWKTLVETVNGLPAPAPMVERDVQERDITTGTNAVSPQPRGPVVPPVTVLSVTHGGMLQWLLKSSFGATLEHPVPWMPLVLAANCSLFTFDARPVRGSSRNGEPLRWYYGQWTTMNYSPANPAESAPQMREQFHTAGGGVR